MVVWLQLTGAKAKLRGASTSLPARARARLPGPPRAVLTALPKGPLTRTSWARLEPTLGQPASAHSAVLWHPTRNLLSLANSSTSSQSASTAFSDLNAVNRLKKSLKTWNWKMLGDKTWYKMMFFIINFLLVLASCLSEVGGASNNEVIGPTISTQKQQQNGKSKWRKKMSDYWILTWIW